MARDEGGGENDSGQKEKRVKNIRGRRRRGSNKMEEI